MTVLLTSIGSFAADAVIRALREFSPGIQIIGTDINPGEYLLMARNVDFFYRVSSAFDQSYLEEILHICKLHKVDYMIPLTDPEVDALSGHEDVFDDINCRVTISNQKTIRTCRDKQALYEAFKNSDVVSVIPTFTYDQLDFSVVNYPMVAKPASGRSSEGLSFIQSENELKSFSQKDKYIFQEFISGQIHTIDVVLDSFKNFAGLSRKELMRTSNGAGLCVKTENNMELIEISKQIALKLEVLGCMNFEFIGHGSEYFLMDINPRFSAGVAFSKLAGYDFVANHLRAFGGEKIVTEFEMKEILATKHYVEYVLK